MRIESRLSSASVDDHIDSPTSFVSLISARASESTDDNILIIHRPVPRRGGSGFLRQRVRTTPLYERSSGQVLILHLVDEDVVELADNDGYDNDAENPPWGGDRLVGLPSVLTSEVLEGITRICHFPPELSIRIPSTRGCGLLLGGYVYMRCSSLISVFGFLFRYF